MFTVAILTISDAVSKGTREDTSGDNIEGGGARGGSVGGRIARSCPTSAIRSLAS